MPLYRLCPVCGRKQPERSTGRCSSCSSKRQYHRHGYASKARAYLDNHVAQHGLVCPGAPDLEHAPHPVERRSDLTVDHTLPLSAGGSLLNELNWRPLCRSANARTGR